MKRYNKIGVIFVCVGLGAFYSTCIKADETGKSFFMPKVIGEDAVLMNALRHDMLDRIYEHDFSVVEVPKQNSGAEQPRGWFEYLFFRGMHKKNVGRVRKSLKRRTSYKIYKKKLKAAFSATAFYEQSTHSSKGLARYFFPNGKTELSIDTQPDASTDIWAPWLNVVGKEDSTQPDQNTALPFHSKLTMRPTHKSFGIILQGVKKNPHGFFIGVDVPCVQVENDLRVTEFDITNAAQIHDELPQKLVALSSPPGGMVTTSGSYKQLQKISINALQAFNSDLWRYGKIKNGPQKLAGFADIHLKIGYELYQRSSTFFTVHLNTVIPTGYKPRAEFVFEPLIGNGQHFGCGFGIDAGTRCISAQQCDLFVRAMCNVNYLFPGTELRSFDLKSQGVWSRYLLVADPQATGLGATPAINFLTLKTRVEPGVVINALADMALDFDWGNIEVGYNFWFKARERLRIKQDPEPVNFVAIDQLTSQAAPAINQTVNGTPDFNTLLKKSDLDVSVARNLSRMSHAFFANISCDASCNQQPIIFTAGFKYEFGHDNRTLDQWAIMGGFKLLV